MAEPTPYYQDDFVTLYHGDCREILPTLGRVDAVVTDPPYGLGDVLSGGGGKWGLWDDGSGRTPHGFDWDTEAPEAVAHLPEIADHSIIWGGNYFPLPPRRGWLIWDKVVRNFTSGHCELAWTTLDQPVRAYNFAHGELASEGKFHPTQKPLRLMTWCIGFLPESAALVLDPFAGSGSTLVAAKRLGRKAIGVELDERYCEIAARRLTQGVLDLFGPTGEERTDGV